MSTLLITEIFPPRTGGSGRWFWELNRRLPREQFLIAAGESPGHEAFDRQHDLRVLRRSLTLSSWGLRSLAGVCGYTRATLAMREIVRTQQVQRIHCGRLLPEGWIAWLLKQWSGLQLVLICW